MRTYLRRINIINTDRPRLSTDNRALDVCTTTRLQIYRFFFCLLFFRSEQSYDSHASLMPWPSVLYSDTALRQDLTECFNVRGIPHLVLTDSHGNVITENGRAEVTEDPDGAVKHHRFILLLPVQCEYETVFTHQ